MGDLSDRETQYSHTVTFVLKHQRTQIHFKSNKTFILKSVAIIINTSGLDATLVVQVLKSGTSERTEVIRVSRRKCH